MYENKQQYLDTLIEKMNLIIKRKVEQKRESLDRIRGHYILQNPNELYKKQSIKLNGLIEKLEAMNPMSVLKRGYTVSYQDDHVISSKEDIKIDSMLETVFFDGKVVSKVIEVKEK